MSESLPFILSPAEWTGPPYDFRTLYGSNGRRVRWRREGTTYTGILTFSIIRGEYYMFRGALEAPAEISYSVLRCQREEVLHSDSVGYLEYMELSAEWNGEQGLFYVVFFGSSNAAADLDAMIPKEHNMPREFAACFDNLKRR